jgi:hypothetical protein
MSSSVLSDIKIRGEAELFFMNTYAPLGNQLSAVGVNVVK